MTEIAKQEQKKPIPVGTYISQAIREIHEMIEVGAFECPENYSYVNAIQSARFELVKTIEFGKHKGETLVDVCQPDSILRTIVQMVTKGLSLEKKQCYFVPYGNQLTLSVSYQGNVALAKRHGHDIEDVYAYAVYEGEPFSLGYTDGIYFVKEYQPDVTKWDKNKIVGAFATVVNQKREVIYTEYMTMEQIRAAWAQGGSNGTSPAHKNFPDQMAIKTVKSRAVKSFVNSGDDSDLIDVNQSMAQTDSILRSSIEQDANKALFVPAEKTELPTPDSVDVETGEILGDASPSDYLGRDFQPIDPTKAPF